MDDACARHITRDGRNGEVCMVLVRPDGRIWTAAKTFYPNHISRLLTGGIQPAEDPASALLREIAEETSLIPTHTTPIAHIAYDTVAPFVTHVYVCTVSAADPIVIDEAERIHHFAALHPIELHQRATDLCALPDTYHPDIGTSWRRWGAFRAISHRIVADWFGTQADHPNKD
jgi:8-oxo-dGTP pyrophosphatase MutT (NUDIX family)